MAPGPPVTPAGGERPMSTPKPFDLGDELEGRLRDFCRRNHVDRVTNSLRDI